MAKPKGITQEQKNEMIAMRQQGLSMREIGAFFGLHYDTVRYHLSAILNKEDDEIKKNIRSVRAAYREDTRLLFERALQSNNLAQANIALKSLRELDAVDRQPEALPQEPQTLKIVREEMDL